MPRLSLLLAVFAFAWNLSAGEPLELNPVADVSICSLEKGQPSKVDGESPTLRLMGGAEKHRIMMRFEFDAATSKPCAGATLRLTTDKCWPNKTKPYIRVQRLLRPFSERWTSWTNSQEFDEWLNPGGDFDPNAIAAVRIAKESGAGQSIDIDVTGLVQAWQSKTVPNLGLLLTLEDDSDSNVHVYAREGATKPKLMLYYTTPMPKIPEMTSVNALKPLGTLPRPKTEVMAKPLNKATVGVDYKQQLVARGGIAPYTWKATGLPDGLTLGEDGVLAGKAAKAGAFSPSFTATGADKQSATLKMNLQVDEAVVAGKDGKPEVKADPAALLKPADKTEKPAETSKKKDDANE